MQMLETGFSAPHYLASQTGNEILAQGGSAIDAMVAAAATIAVVYPHMNSLGGDGFWLIQRQGEKPVAIDACGRSAAAIDADGFSGAMPSRGELACITQAGTVAGWQRARDYLSTWREPIPLSSLFTDAIHYCHDGVMATDSYVAASEKILGHQAGNAAFHAIYTDQRHSVKSGDLIKNPALAGLLKQLATHGLDDFYRGETANTIADFFAYSESSISLSDFKNYTAEIVEPLSVKTSLGTLYNLPAPTQGFASLLILAIYDRLYQPGWDKAEQVHHLVEATKQAFLLRDQYLTDPAAMSVVLTDLLSDHQVKTLADTIDSARALDWPKLAQPGDTVWMGAVDDEGTMVSFIQSIYWEFGSGIVIPELGLLWNNRGVSFSLDKTHVNYLQPGKKPFHTLNPALGVFNDGARLAYGTMGGEGQPQTQAAIINYFKYQQQPLAASISMPRWLLGRTWGDATNNLKLEASLMDEIGVSLAELGHVLESVTDHNEMMGHAGAVYVDHAQSVTTAVDPRSDGMRPVQ